MGKKRSYYGIATSGRSLAKLETEMFLRRIREAKTAGPLEEKRDVTSFALTIPETMTGAILEEVAKRSKLLPFVYLTRFKGTARQLVGCSITDAVWTGACDQSPETILDLREAELDANKVSGYFGLCDAVRDSSDPFLFDELVWSIGGAIGKAIDKAILFGTGINMPCGICTRLAQTVQPTGWNETMPVWEDLHSSNVITLDVDEETGPDFFTPISDALSAAKPVFSEEDLFWAMNRKTHRHLLAKAGAYSFDNKTNIMPIIGGTIIDFDDSDIPDNQIIGGYGGNFIMGERSNMSLSQSEHYYFLQDQTVYKGTGHYDGMPAGGRAFVVLRYDGTAPTTSIEF